MMKVKSLFLLLVFALIPSVCLCSQTDVTVVAPATEAGEDLDLYGVLELFKEAEDLEALEKALNDPKSEVNNLDLNEDGEVDYIRVVEHVEGNTHVITLQVPLGDDDYQDMATIEIEKKGEEDYTLQCVGEEEIYGEDYIVEPDPEPQDKTTVVVIRTLPIVRLIFRPGYRPWVSPWRWRRYPGWWKPWRPVARSVHRSRVRRFHKPGFRHTKVRRSPRARNMHQKHRRSSTKAKKGKTTQRTKTQTQKKKKKRTPDRFDFPYLWPHLPR
jgi:hypothetical protein